MDERESIEDRVFAILARGGSWMSDHEVWERTTYPLDVFLQALQRLVTSGNVEEAAERDEDGDILEMHYRITWN